MLNILSEFVGFSGWDEFSFEEKSVQTIQGSQSEKSKISKKWLLLLFIPLALVVVFFSKKEESKPKTIQLNNEYTNEKVNAEEVKVFEVKDSVKRELEIKGGKVQVSNNGNEKSKLVIQSPFYLPKTIVINPNGTTTEPPKRIDLKPDDYAMMLKAFMLSDIKDWQTRKEQLNKILSDNLEVIVMLKDDLGAEYFNKSEFSQKLIVPTASLKKMKIVEIKNDANDKIQFIRIKQE
jgi:hypothetical protein